MEVWEDIVNKNAEDNANKYNESHTRKKLYQKRTIISGAVGLAFVLTALIKLAHPCLGEAGMIVALCVAWYNLGRVKECTQ